MKQIYPFLHLLIILLLAASCSPKSTFYFSPSTGSFSPAPKKLTVDAKSDTTFMHSAQPIEVAPNPMNFTAAGADQNMAGITLRKKVPLADLNSQPLLKQEVIAAAGKSVRKNNQFKGSRQHMESRPGDELRSNKLSRTGLILTLLTVAFGILTAITGGALLFLFSIATAIGALVTWGLWLAEKNRAPETQSKIRKKRHGLTIGLSMVLALLVVFIGFIIAYSG